jgi:NADP-dependent 3-hydroxy acid dehydrogenase YdfG
VNLKGTLAVTRALLPGMIERRRGHLFFITSMIGPNAAPNASVYAATKAGVRALASCLRLELAGKRVRVTEIAPGRVHTTFFSPSFKGDMEAVEKTLFDEYDALEPTDVAAALTGALDLPEHADINRIEITSTDQALGGMTYAKRAS